MRLFGFGEVTMTGRILQHIDRSSVLLRNSARRRRRYCVLAQRAENIDLYADGVCVCVCVRMHACVRGCLPDCTPYWCEMPQLALLEGRV